MKKDLIKSEIEYRKYVWDILLESNFNSKLERAFGIVSQHDCYDYNDKNELIDENGVVLRDPTGPQDLILEEEIESLSYPLIIVSWIEEDDFRGSKYTIIAVEFVELSEFNK